MPWDQSRPVPWKRLLTFEAIYVGIFAGFVLIVQRDKIGSAVTSILFAVALTTILMYSLIKFGYHPNWLRSRAEMAAARSEKMAARRAMKAAKSGKPPPRTDVRDRPAPTKRTSAGPNNQPRRTRDTRKR